MAGPIETQPGPIQGQEWLAPSPGGARRSDQVTLGLVAGAAVLAAVSGLAGSNKLLLVLPLAAAAALGLGVVAITRFEAYILILLAARASLDLARFSPSGGGGLARALDPAGLLGVQFLVLAGFWLAAQHRDRTLVTPSRATLALGLFVAAAALSLVSSRDLFSGAVELLRLATAVTMFAILEQLVSSLGGLKRLLTAVFASSLFPLAFTAFGFLTGEPRTEAKGAFLRIMGPFNQSNAFGRYLMILTIAGAALWPHLDRRQRRWMTGVLAGCAVFLPLTYTRSAIIGTALGLLVVGMLQSRRLIVGVVVTSVVAVLLVPQFGSRFAELAEPSTSSLDNRGNSFRWRLDYWSEVVALGSRSPVWGIGLGETQTSTEARKQPHNDFLRAFVEMGVIGLAAYLLSLAALVHLAYSALRRTASERDEPSIRRGVAVGFAGGIAAFVSVSLVANVMTNVVNLWYFVAFAAAASYVARSEESSHRWRSASI